MNLQIAGHHIEVTPALRDYVENKLDPVIRHFDKVTGVNVVLSVEKLKQKAEVTVHVPGKDMHVDVIDTFKFNDDNKVIEMRAYFGPTNMHGFA